MSVGIVAYEFDRETAIGDSYTILHLTMDVKRQTPNENQRPPGDRLAEGVDDFHCQVVRQLFEEEPNIISTTTVADSDLKPNLGQIEARRRKYLNGL